MVEGMFYTCNERECKRAKAAPHLRWPWQSHLSTVYTVLSRAQHCSLFTSTAFISSTSTFRCRCLWPSQASDVFFIESILCHWDLKDAEGRMAWAIHESMFHYHYIKQYQWQLEGSWSIPYKYQSNPSSTLWYYYIIIDSTASKWLLNITAPSH